MDYLCECGSTLQKTNTTKLDALDLICPSCRTEYTFWGRGCVLTKNRWQPNRDLPKMGDKNETK